MNFLRLFFSFYGRIGRTVYLGGLFVNLAAALTVLAITNSTVLIFDGNPTVKTFEGVVRFYSVPILSLASLAALHARRLHDQGQSAWWVIPAFAALGLCGWWIFYAVFVIAEGKFYGLLLAIPAAGIINFIIFLFAYPRGQSGPNRFGADPRNEEQTNKGESTHQYSVARLV